MGYNASIKEHKIINRRKKKKWYTIKQKENQSNSDSQNKNVSVFIFHENAFLLIQATEQARVYTI